MPFITEELWDRLAIGENRGSISLERFPELKHHDDWRDEESEREMALLQEAIVALRNLRAEMKIDARKRSPGELSSPEADVRKLFETHREPICRLATLSGLTISADALPDEGGRVHHAPRFDARIEFAEGDVEGELDRLRKERDNLTKQIASADVKLSNEQFLSKAPEQVVSNIRQKKQDLDTQFEKVASLLARLEERRDTADSEK